MPKLKSKKTKPVTSTRPAVYEKVEAKLCIGDQAITMKVAQKMLGWQAQPAEATDYDFIDFTGSKIKCHHNKTNRPIYQTALVTLKQEHLRKRWRVNGEPIIIGVTALILNGQHSLISFILACQEWNDDPDKWPEWESEPVMEKLVVFGIDESDEVVNTMDTCKPRTFADAIYRSGFFPSTLPKSDMKRICRTLDYAVKMLWHRTGADENPFAPRRTHAEGLAFIAKHPKIVEAVKHIHEEDGTEKKIGRYLSTGYAAGLLYLMACCKSENVEEYKLNPSESLLDMTMFEDACDFWTMVGAGERAMAALKACIQKSIEETGASRTERTALIIKAWGLRTEGKPLTEKALALEYTENEDGFRSLSDNPTLGGIDSIKLSEHAMLDPTAEEIEERAEAIKAENADKKKNGKKKKGQSEILAGMQVWVPEAEEDGGGYWTGKVEDSYQGPNGLVCRVKVKTGKIFEVAASDCLSEQPSDL